ncbi:glycoside hydrolase family 2 TIM barrel-domain containing protein [Paenarthrobacter nicotinovorans]|uniref:glycoside hydrolase family 2 TIM barrel-domain containing protein n=1 Tax=Paenarthrobacter nicotinovorans TaxID=29320 RepID=UPI003747F701
MSFESFNAGWVIRPKTSIFAQLMGPTAAGEAVTLPHDALIRQQRSADHRAGQAYFPDGTFEYTKHFDVPLRWRNKRVAIEFQGVYRDAVVFVNGVAAAQRPYGYSMFTVQLDPYLRYGEENTVRVESRAHDDSRWYTGAGIYRDTRLIVSELVHISYRGIRITTPDVDAERAVVEATVNISNEGIHTSTVSLDVDVLDKHGNVVASGATPVTVLAGKNSTAHVRTYVYSPALWNVDDPQLYSARVRLSQSSQPIDEQNIVFGVRTLQLDPRHGLRINGHGVKLRGTCVHHDNGILGAAAIARAEERRVEQLKAAGFNAIRAAHNPISEAMLDACDRVGMLVMDEAFDIWTESKSPLDYSLSFQEWWERDLEAMISKDINHPSVIMYSIGNEIPETGNPFGAEWGRKLAEKIRFLDPNRFVTNGINPLVSTINEVAAIARGLREQTESDPDGGVNDLMAKQRQMQDEINRSEMVTKRTAESYGVLDVAGLNYADARYELDQKLFPNRVIVGSETFTPRIAENWDLILRSPHVIGDFAWTGYDYLGEVGIGRVQYTDETPAFQAPYPWIAAWCGDMDITGHRRPSSFYREIVFGLRAKPYIAVQRPENYGRTAVAGAWAWSDSIGSWTWAVEPGTPIRVEVYSDGDEVELLLDGRSTCRQRPGVEVPLTAVFDTVYQPGELTAVAYRHGEETGRTSLRSATGNVRLTVAPDRTSLMADDRDLAFVAIELQDETGTVVTSEQRQVRVSVEGSGTLQAFGSGRPDNTERYDADQHATFDGRALAVVRPTGPGLITLTASAPGMEAVVARLTAISPSTTVSGTTESEASDSVGALIT